MAPLNRISRTACALAATLLLTAHGYALSPEDITAETAVLMDADTGQILFDKNIDARRRPASITKIMTGLLVLELCRPDEVVVVGESTFEIPHNTSHIALTPGEELPVDSAMYAMMLPSANDAALALAEHAAGSQAAFASLMNERAQQLGAQNTNFTNAHGLDNVLHYTTARDMALITRQAISTPGFLTYFGAGRHTIPATNRQPQERPFTNQQYMLLPDMWVYSPEVIGGKVGFTDEARHTMSTAAARGGRTLIAVVMGCGIDEKFYDTQALFDYGFDALAPVQLPVEKLSGITVPVTEAGEPVGEATFSVAEIPPILLPAGLGEQDIAYEYLLPETVEKDGSPQASVRLTLPEGKSGGFPDTLLEIPLEASIRIDSQPVPLQSLAVEQDSPFDWETVWSDLQWPFLLAAGVLAAIVAARKVQISRRRAARMRRLERVMRARGHLE